MILTYGDSKTGLVRKNNEDAINLDIPGLYILADGMGGYDGGQIASRIAVDSVKRYFLADSHLPFSEEGLSASIQAANRDILQKKEETGDYVSMGTTIVLAALSGNTLDWAHVGDSRLYVWHDGSLRQITTDHSFVMELVTEGKISKEAMRTHPRKNEITRAVGIEPSLKVDTGHLTLKPDSLILLCTDGLTGMVEDEELSHLIAENPRQTQADLKTLGDALMEQVYDAGARDNVSFILAAYQ